MSNLLFYRKQKLLKPIITFSREPGSGGRLVAQLVGKKLKYEFYDKNLIDLISQQSGLEKDIVMNLDEQKENTLTAILKRLFGKEPFPEQAYIRALSHTILAIAAKGSSVVLGRGANFIAPEDKCLRVRIISPLVTRIRAHALYDSHSEAEARDSIRKIHFDRKDFVHKYFSKNISNTNYYDLVINTKRIKLADAADLVVKIYQERFRL